MTGAVNVRPPAARPPGAEDSSSAPDTVAALTAQLEAAQAEVRELRARLPLSHAIQPWGEEMRELMASFERHLKAQRHVSLPRLDREEWGRKNGCYYQHGEANSLFLLFMSGYQSAKPGWLDGHYYDCRQAARTTPGGL